MGLPDAELQKNADKILKNLVDALKPIQDSYFQAKNKMWQGIKTPRFTPKDGNKDVPDKSLKPIDQVESWNDVAVPLPITMEISTAVDVYEGPQGWGYMVRGEIDIEEKAWNRTINIGPEKYWEHDWMEINIDISKNKEVKNARL